MKNIFFGSFLLVATLFVFACGDYEEDAFSFDNSLPQYVELGSASPAPPSGQDSIFSGDMITVEVDLRQSRSTDVVVNYEVTGGFSASGTVTIAKYERSGTSSLAIPAGPSGTATLKLTAVDNGLTIGRNGPESGLDNTEWTINYFQK